MMYTPAYVLVRVAFMKKSGRVHTFRLCQKFGRLGKVLKNPGRSASNEDGKQSFQDEYPGPPRPSADAVHVMDSRGEEAT